MGWSDIAMEKLPDWTTTLLLYVQMFLWNFDTEYYTTRHTDDSQAGKIELGPPLVPALSPPVPACWGTSHSCLKQLGSS